VTGARMEKPAESRLQPGLAAPQLDPRFLESMNAARKRACSLRYFTVTVTEAAWSSQVN
jgi:hypothetical protein